MVRSVSSRPTSIRAAIADLKAGKPIFVGEVKSNTGKVVTSKDAALYEPSLETTDYLVEGIVGSV
jgi:basic membrane protein A